MVNCFDLKTTFLAKHPTGWTLVLLACADQTIQVGIHQSFSIAIPTVTLSKLRRRKEDLVSKDIIQTALTNKTLRLELTYTVLPMLRQGDDTGMEPVTHTGLACPDSVLATSDELACLLSVI